MCGRVVQAMSWAEIHHLLNIHSEPPAQAEPRYNVAPTTQVQMVLPLEASGRLAPVRWGWRPHWAQDRAAPINARAETVPTSKFFRAIWPHRMLCPISGWYEWVDEGEPKKAPYYIRRRDGAPTFCAAIGQVHDEPRDDDGFVIITADALGGLVDVHDRRPVALAPELAREWLDPATPRERAEQMLQHGEGPEAFEWYRVDRAVGNVRNQGPQLIEPLPSPLI
ncbi:SOS response-associated peptidase [Pseudomonas otitidis]|uniref:SOS response-associated peptidase n=1 Tax=Metapseudomonas otitidis TaxID=319939 RepID=UPI0024ADEA02|nr:SOS response-associated peptidase [Pseudomonas otitidis]MDI6527396.1 SOS response-associated peptidase [Pseudomonas otitidis]